MLTFRPNLERISLHLWVYPSLNEDEIVSLRWNEEEKTHRRMFRRQKCKLWKQKRRKWICFDFRHSGKIKNWIKSQGRKKNRSIVKVDAISDLNQILELQVQLAIENWFCWEIKAVAQWWTDYHFERVFGNT